MSVDRAKEQLELAEGRWQAAISEHSQAPPDAGFSRRLRAVADAAAQEQTAYRYADGHGFGWRPGLAWLPPHEFRPAPDNRARRHLAAIRRRDRRSLPGTDGRERGSGRAGLRRAVRSRLGARPRGGWALAALGASRAQR